MKNNYQIAFDLLTGKEYEKVLKTKYNKSLSSMYSLIKKHLIKNGFEWVEGSTYHTKGEITAKKLNRIIDDLYENNLWLSYFTRDLKRTIIKEVEYNYNNVIKNYQDELAKKK